MTKIEMVTISKRRSATMDAVSNIEGSIMFEDDVNTALEKIEKNNGQIISINYKFAVEKNYYIYTAMIIYVENNNDYDL